MSNLNPFPKHREESIIKLYHASINELGNDINNLRMKNFLKIVTAYYPWLNSVEIKSIRELFSNLEAKYFSKIISKKIYSNYGLKLLHFFGEIDENNDGKISIEEFEKYLSYILEGDTRKYFEDADINGDGVLDIKEFCDFISKNKLILKNLEEILNLANNDLKNKRNERLLTIFKHIPLDENGNERRPSLLDIRKN